MIDETAAPEKDRATEPPPRPQADGDTADHRTAAPEAPGSAGSQVDPSLQSPAIEADSDHSASLADPIEVPEVQHPAGSADPGPTPLGESLPESESQSFEASEGRAADDRRYIRIRRSHFYALMLPLAFVAGIAYGYLLWGKEAFAELAPAESDQAESSRAVARLEVDLDDDPSLGPAEAPITIIEFSDFNCPYCQRWHREVFEPLMASYPGQIRFVYRDFPIVGGGAPGMAAAQAANCAREQNLYWEFHDALFSGSYPLNTEGFTAASGAAGVDSKALLTCYESGRYEAEVQADLRYAAGLGVSATPTFFINGIPLVGAQPLLRFVEVINAELGE